MNRLNLNVIGLIRKTVRYGMVVLPLLMFAQNVSAEPDNKDNKDKRPPMASNSRPMDSGSRADAPRYTPPARQAPVNNSPQVDRGNRNGYSPAPSFNQSPRGGSSAINNAPAINRNLNETPRMMRGGNSDNRSYSPPSVKNNSPASIAVGPLPSVNKSSNAGSGGFSGGKFSPAITPQPVLGSNARNNNSMNDSQLRAQRPDMNNRMDRKNDLPRNPPSNNTNNSNNTIKNNPPSNNPPRNNPPKINNPISNNPPKINNPISNNPPKINNPVSNNPPKINNPPSNNLNKGNNSGVQGVKTPPPSIKTNDKPADKIIKKPADSVTGKKVDNTPGKTVDKPVDKGGRFNPGSRIDGGLKKPDNIALPNTKLPQGKDAVPSGVKTSDAGGNIGKDDKGKNDAFKPGRFEPIRRPGKVAPQKVDKTKPGDVSKEAPSDLKAGDLTKRPPSGVKPGDVSKEDPSSLKAGDLTKRPPSGLKPDDMNKFGPRPLTPGDVPKNLRDQDLKNVRDNMNNRRFDDRLKSGELDKVTKGEMAKKLNLGDQYKNMHKGDVARRMDLQKHALHDQHAKTINNVTLVNLRGITPKHGHYYGHIHHNYANHCFKYNYWGPSFFAGVCLYPHWSPWIGWSWQYHCHPMWDPRPLWCRPIVYEPYVVWNYWQPPVWQPLPEATVGTWVDVKPVVVEPEQFDLQLLAVRMVDPGHPEEKLGPRYRVWFRNNSSKPITEPFSVMLFAGNDKTFGEDLPRGGVRVTSIEAGDTQSVDIRLPIEVYEMNKDAQGQPAPFEFLHFFVDANREVNDENLANNGAVVPRDEMLPVDPAAFETDPVQGSAGSELILAGEGFGPQPGQVMLHIGNQEVQAEIVGWYDLGVKFAVPKMEVPVATEAEVIVVRGDGAAANPLKITILPDAPLEAEQEGPVLEIPAER